MNLNLPGPVIETKRAVGINGSTIYSASCARGDTVWRVRLGMDYASSDEANHLAAANKLLHKHGVDWEIHACGNSQRGMVFICR